MLCCFSYVCNVCKREDVDVRQNTVSKTTKINHGGFSVFDGDCRMVAVFGVAKIGNSIRSLASLATVQGLFALISLACFTGPLFMIF